MLLYSLGEVINAISKLGSPAEMILPIEDEIRVSKKNNCGIHNYIISLSGQNLLNYSYIKRHNTAATFNHLNWDLHTLYEIVKASNF